MKLALCLLVALAACGNDRRLPVVDEPPPDAGPDLRCVVDPATFVRSAILALDGRRARSQAEVEVFVDLYAAAEAAGEDPKTTVANALMARPEFAERWIDPLMDALHVQRTDVQSEAACWQDAIRPVVDATLATLVRDQPATAAGPGPWTMLDLARSALVLDDLTPLYRAQLFSLVQHPIPAANVPPNEAELARRDDLGTRFDAAYLNRDIVCLGCHTSESSVTNSDDPVTDRHWPTPGAPEAAVYGSAAGVSPDRAHAAFRVSSFVVLDGPVGGVRPWSWAVSCGQFNPPASVPVDPTGVEAQLASITGRKATVHDLERALARGFATLAASGPPAAGTTLTDPDAALAWLVVLKMTEDIWKEAVGTPLTIANYYPRNRAASELLASLAGTLVTSHYSLKALLVAIVSSEYFDLLAPERGCGTTAYPLPPVFDPWVTSDPDMERRGNSLGDAVQPLPPHMLVSAAAAALDWPPHPLASRFPDYGEYFCEGASCSELADACGFGYCCVTYERVCENGAPDPTVELPFQRNIGMFLRNSERGFRGLDFVGRLAWEERYGACAMPDRITEDFITQLVAAGAANPAATTRDVIAALKDRLVGESLIAEGAETTALTAIVGALDAPASTVAEPAVRQVCAALLASPQFLLRGLPGAGGSRPLLTPPGADYAAMCAELAGPATCTGGRPTLAALRYDPAR